MVTVASFISYLLYKHSLIDMSTVCASTRQAAQPGLSAARLNGVVTAIVTRRDLAVEQSVWGSRPYRVTLRASLAPLAAPPPPRPTPPAYPPAMVSFGRLGGGGSKGGLRWRYARHSRTSCPLAPRYRQPCAACGSGGAAEGCVAKLLTAQRDDGARESIALFQKAEVTYNACPAAQFLVEGGDGVMDTALLRLGLGA